jgi:hypothetical protein
VAEVAAKALVAQAPPHVLVARDEPASEPFVVEDACSLAHAVEDGIGILEEDRIRRIEAHLILYKHGLTIGLGRPS